MHESRNRPRQDAGSTSSNPRDHQLAEFQSMNAPGNEPSQSSRQKKQEQSSGLSEGPAGTVKGPSGLQGIDAIRSGFLALPFIREFKHVARDISDNRQSGYAKLLNTFGNVATLGLGAAGATIAVVKVALPVFVPLAFGFGSPVVGGAVATAAVVATAYFAYKFCGEGLGRALVHHGLRRLHHQAWEASSYRKEEKAKEAEEKAKAEASGQGGSGRRAPYRSRSQQEEDQGGGDGERGSAALGVGSSRVGSGNQGQGVPRGY